MSAENRIVNKLRYRYPQINNFVSVKELLFIRENESNHLLIRFCNLCDVTVNEIAFTVIELDYYARVLGRHYVNEDTLDIRPGDTYSPTSDIAISTDCCDCKIIIHHAISGKYLYREHEGKIITDFIKPQHEIVTDSSTAKPQPLFHTSSEHSKNPKASLILCIVFTIVIIMLCFARPIISYYTEDIRQYIQEYLNEVWQSIIHAFNTN